MGPGIHLQLGESKVEVLEIVEQFGAASYETQRIEAHWRHGSVQYCDTLVRIVRD